MFDLCISSDSNALIQKRELIERPPKAARTLFEMMTNQINGVVSRDCLAVHDSTIIAQLFAFLAQMLRVNFALVGHVESVWFVERTLKRETV